MTLFDQECPGHGFITEQGDADMHDCGGDCVRTTPISNETYEQHQGDTGMSEEPGKETPLDIQIVANLVDATLAAEADPTPENLEAQKLAADLAKYAQENRA